MSGAARRPAGTLPHRFGELLALRCGLRVTNYMVGKFPSSWLAVRWLQAAIPCSFVPVSCYCLGTEVCAITEGVFAISLGVYAIMLRVFTSRNVFIGQKLIKTSQELLAGSVSSESPKSSFLRSSIWQSVTAPRVIAPRGSLLLLSFFGIGAGYLQKLAICPFFWQEWHLASL